MKPGQPVKIKTTDKEGVLAFVDNYWNNLDGSPADLLCKVSFENEGYSWHRLSELEPDDRKIEKKKMKHKIDFEEFMEIAKKLEIKIGIITGVERVPKSDKMLKLNVNFGAEDCSVATNIGNKIEPELLLGKSFPFVTNLKPVTMMGIESVAMIMVPTHTDGTLDFQETPLAGSALI
jgi:methionine--tRNA ligase beta chain